MQPISSIHGGTNCADCARPVQDRLDNCINHNGDAVKGSAFGLDDISTRYTNLLRNLVTVSLTERYSCTLAEIIYRHAGNMCSAPNG